MAKWRVYAIMTADKYIGDVEAESEEEAIDKGFELDDCQTPYLCHHCNHEINLSDVNEVQVERIEDN